MRSFSIFSGEVKRNITIGHKNDGGLDMIDISIFSNAMKIKWGNNEMEIGK